MHQEKMMPNNHERESGGMQDPVPGQGNRQGRQDGDSRQSGDQADALRGGQGDRQSGERQSSRDEVGTARPRNDPTPNG
jgi:hypothetical protein